VLNPEGEIKRLTLEFQEDRDKVWVDEAIPWEEKQNRVDELWRQFDDRRRELREGTGGELVSGPVSEVTGRRRKFMRRKRASWK
jgi:hypothetical protein